MVRKAWIPLMVLLLASATVHATMAVAQPEPDLAEPPSAQAIDSVVRDAKQQAEDVLDALGAESPSPPSEGGIAAPETNTEQIVADVEAAAADALELADGMVLRPAKRHVEALSYEVTYAVMGESEPPKRFHTEANAQPKVAVDYTVPLLIAGAAVTAAGAGVVIWLAGSSSSMGAAGAAARTSDIRKVLPIASPLFTRFEKDTVMGHPKREELYALIVSQPGIPLQQMCEATGLSRTAVTHHLRLLEHHHLIVSRRVGRSRHFYENGGRYGREQKEAYAVLQNDRSREVAQFIRRNPGAIQKQLCAALGLQASIAHWHVRRLQEAALIEANRSGRTVSYFPTAGLQTMDAN